MRSLAILLMLGLALAGCSSSSEDPADSTVEGDTTPTPSGTGTSTARPSGTADPSPTSSSGPPSGAPENAAPQASLAANATEVAVGSTVNFTIDGTDDDGDALSWSLTVEDVLITGESVPAFAEHTFQAVGNVTVELVVSDGQAQANATVMIVVIEAAPALCEVANEVSLGGLLYVQDRGLSGGVWVYEESNNVPGMQLTAEAGPTGDHDPLGAGCVNGDTLII